MSNTNKLAAIILAICILASSLVACSSPAPAPVTYDPNKSYAAFIVSNRAESADVLATAKQQAAGDKLEIGPIEYYGPQTTNFDPFVQKVTVSKQVTVIWVIGGLMDMSAVRKSATKLGFKGTVRFNPVGTQTLPGQ